MFALSLADGAVLEGWPVDVGKIVGTGFIGSTQNRRGALAIFEGKVPSAACGAIAAYTTGASSRFQRADQQELRLSPPVRTAAAFGVAAA
jgi:hypothetical protein